MLSFGVLSGSVVHCVSVSASFCQQSWQMGKRCPLYRISIAIFVGSKLVQEKKGFWHVSGNVFTLRLRLHRSLLLVFQALFLRA